jgi:hypothetical protein
VAQCKIKDAGVLEGIMKFTIYTELNIVDDIEIIIRMEDERIPPLPLKKKVLNLYRTKVTFAVTQVKV